MHDLFTSEALYEINITGCISCITPLDTRFPYLDIGSENFQQNVLYLNTV